MTSARSDSAQRASRLREAVTLLSRRLRPRLQQDGISVVKLSVLGQLYRGGPLTPTELAAREGGRLQTLTRLLATLELEGWLIRQTSSADARQSALTLSKPGAKRLMDAALASEASLAKTIDTELSPGERDVLMQACALMERIDKSLSEKAVRSTTGSVASSASAEGFGRGLRRPATSNTDFGGFRSQRSQPKTRK